MSRAVNQKDPQSFVQAMQNVPKVLGRLGFKGMRPGQEKVVVSVLSGFDSYVVAPTAFGKSATYIIPTLAANWRTMIVSPLISLIEDQNNKLAHKWKVASAQISSGQSAVENDRALRDWMQGRLQFIFVSPERLENADFKKVISHVKPDLVVLDESHCLSEWSHTFRPSYRKVGEFIADFNPRVVLTLTATSTEEIEKDVRDVLGLQHARKLFHYEPRTNLDLRSIRKPAEYRSRLVGLIEQINGPTVIYAASIKTVEETFLELQDEPCIKGITYYHGELGAPDKKANMEAFMNGNAQVCVATNAFGMGVDRADVRGVIHIDVPGTVEACAQEQGRGGRDGKPTLCVMMYNDRSFGLQEFFIRESNPSDHDVRAVFNTLKRSADLKGRVEITVADLAKRSGASACQAALNTLRFFGVIENIKTQGKAFGVRIKGEPETTAQVNYFRAIAVNCTDTGTGYLTGDLLSVAADLGVKEQTVRNNLRRMHQEGLIEFTPPFNGQPRRIIGDINNVDFDTLNTRMNRAYEKLDQVREYCLTPDNAKHAFLEKYFRDVAS